MSKAALAPFEPPERRFELIPLNRIKPLERPRWLVREIIPRVGLAVVFGEPKCGKSFWAVDLALHVAYGWPYRGRKVQAGPVVYIAAEGQGGFADRIEAWRLANLQDEAGDAPFFLVAQPVALVADAEHLRADVTAQTDAPVLIVIDTLARTYTGKEADDESMGAYVKAAESLRDRFSCAVLVVHHTGWNEKERLRGSSALRGAYDTGILITRNEARQVVTKVVDQKDGASDAEIGSELRVIQVATDAEGDPVTSCYIVPVDDAAMPKGRTKLPPQARKALEFLVNAIAEAGERPPMPDLAASVKAVRLTIWADHCRRRGLSGADDPESQQRVFRKVRQKLNDDNHIAIDGEWVWVRGG